MTFACETPSTGAAAVQAARTALTIPSIDTARLHLRAPRIDDFSVYAEITAGPRGVHILDEPTREAAWLDFAQMVATWVLRGHGLWAVQTKADDAVIGFVLLGFEPGDHEPELGYMFREAAEGQGFANEAAIAARDFGFDMLGLPSLVSTIDPDNHRSCRLAERLGASRDSAAEAAFDEDILVYRHPMPRNA